jgi:hypothetical protein
MLAPVTNRLAPCLMLLGLLSCTVLDPRLPPVPPPPNRVQGQVLLELPPERAQEYAQDSVVSHRDSEMPVLGRSNPDRVRRIQAHQVTVGMTSQQVIWVFLGHPTRVRDQGPPGGHTLLWEPGRYFVRFDSAGLADAAGRY